MASLLGSGGSSVVDVKPDLTSEGDDAVDPLGIDRRPPSSRWRTAMMSPREDGAEVPHRRAHDPSPRRPRGSGPVAWRYRTASSTGTTSAYLASMSTRLASCGAAARSPTASRGTRVGKPYC